MRSGELTGAAWGQVDFERRVLTVGRAKTSSGTGRQIPMNNDLFVLLSAHAAWFTKKFGETRPEYYLFPFGSVPNDPTRPTTTLKTAWDSIREDAGVSCRLHDLRHTALTKMAEAGVPESTMLAFGWPHEPGHAGAVQPYPYGGEAGSGRIACHYGKVKRGSARIGTSRRIRQDPIVCK
jgi:hypothetical protein